MPHSVTFDENENVIKITMKGKIDLLSVVDLATEIAAIAEKHDCHLILNDAREAKVELSILQIYDLPRVFLEALSEKGVEVYKFKRALVVPSDVDEFTFFETVSTNRAQNVKIFHDLQDARDWLFRE